MKTKISIIFAMPVLLLLTGCIHSKTPKFQPAPLTSAVVEPGYYQYCFIDNEAEASKQKSECKTVMLRVNNIGEVVTVPSDSKSEGHDVLIQLDDVNYLAQIGNDDKYIFGFGRIGINSSNIKFVFPSCEFTGDTLTELINAGFEAKQDGKHCDVTSIPSDDMTNLFNILQKTNGWKSEFTISYTKLDDKLGAKRYQSEKLEAERKKAKKSSS